MSRFLAFVGRHKFLAAALVAVLTITVLALVVLFTPGADRLAYASPLARAPEAVKQQLRPWRAPRVDVVLPREHAVDVIERAPVTIAFTTPMNKAARACYAFCTMKVTNRCAISMAKAT